MLFGPIDHVERSAPGWPMQRPQSKDQTTPTLQREVRPLMLEIAGYIFNHALHREQRQMAM